MDPVILDVIGYASSVLILVSLLMTSVVKFRVINAIGSLIFTIFALLTASYPTAALNFCLVLVDVWFLWKVLHTKSSYDMDAVAPTDSAVSRFLTVYREDIAQFFPELPQAIPQAASVYLVYADAAPVGILVGERRADGGLNVLLDYSCPSHRDCSVGTYLYAGLAEAGVTALYAESGVDKHVRYLKRMGFVPSDGGYSKRLQTR